MPPKYNIVSELQTFISKYKIVDYFQLYRQRWTMICLELVKVYSLFSMRVTVGGVMHLSIIGSLS